MVGRIERLQINKIISLLHVIDETNMQENLQIIKITSENDKFKYCQSCLHFF